MKNDVVERESIVSWQYKQRNLPWLSLGGVELRISGSRRTSATQINYCNSVSSTCSSHGCREKLLLRRRQRIKLEYGKNTIEKKAHSKSVDDREERRGECCDYTLVSRWYLRPRTEQQRSR